jgi:hypothetical protein
MRHPLEGFGPCQQDLKVGPFGGRVLACLAAGAKSGGPIRWLPFGEHGPDEGGAAVSVCLGPLTIERGLEGAQAVDPQQQEPLARTLVEFHELHKTPDLARAQQCPKCPSRVVPGESGGHRPPMDRKDRGDGVHCPQGSRVPHQCMLDHLPPEKALGDEDGLHQTFFQEALT